jgi:transposase
MARGDLSDQEWARLVSLLPPERGRRGRPALSHRQLLNGMLWRDRTGAPWRDLPERYGHWKTVYSRFRRWTQQGLWTQLLQQLQGRAAAGQEVEWVVVSIDSTTVRAHQHAAGARHAPERAERAERPEKGGPRACSGSPRVPGPQSGRSDHEAASGQRRARATSGPAPERRSAA